MIKSLLLILLIITSCSIQNNNPSIEPQIEITYQLPHEQQITFLEPRKMEIEKIKAFIVSEIRLEKRHPLLKNPDKLHKTAKLIYNTSKITKPDWETMFTIITYESKFKHTVIAKDRPSIGYTQLHGVAWNYCQERLGRKINKKDPEDQILCGAIWLEYCIEACNKTLEQGLAKYATGYMCDYSKSKSVRFIVNRRIKKINELKGI
jgi:hypothetical protein